MKTKAALDDNLADRIRFEKMAAAELRAERKAIDSEIAEAERKLAALKRNRRAISDALAVKTVPMIASRYRVTKYAVRSL